MMAEDIMEKTDDLGDLLNEDSAVEDRLDDVAGLLDEDADLSDGPGEGIDAEGDADVSQFKTYDFKRPYNISRQFEKSMLTVSDGFAKGFSIEFTSLLRANISAQGNGLRLSTFGDYVKSLPELSCVGTVSLSPLTGVSLIQMDLGMSFVLMKRLLGGQIEEEKKVRKFTDIEIGVAGIMMRKILDCLKDSVSKLVKMDTRYIALENSAEYLGTMPAGETMIILPFDVDVDGVVGECCVCIPLTSFEPVWHIFDPEEKSEYRTSTEIQRDRRRMIENIMATTTEVTVTLGEVDQTMQQINAMTVGDLIPLYKSTSAPLTLEVAGRSMFKGIVGKLNQSRALKLTEKLEWED
jgi:flagellar motor switch protein FliM